MCVPSNTRCNGPEEVIGPSATPGGFVVGTCGCSAAARVRDDNSRVAAADGVFASGPDAPAYRPVARTSASSTSSMLGGVGIASPNGDRKGRAELVGVAISCCASGRLDITTLL